MKSHFSLSSSSYGRRNERDAARSPARPYARGDLKRGSFRRYFKYICTHNKKIYISSIAVTFHRYFVVSSVRAKQRCKQIVHGEANCLAKLICGVW